MYVWIENKKQSSETHTHTQRICAVSKNYFVEYMTDKQTRTGKAHASKK